MITHTPAQIRAMTTEELLAAIRALSARPYSSVGDERSQAASLRQHNRPILPYTAELVRRYASENGGAA